MVARWSPPASADHRQGSAPEHNNGAAPLLVMTHTRGPPSLKHSKRPPSEKLPGAVWCSCVCPSRVLNQQTDYGVRPDGALVILPLGLRVCIPRAAGDYRTNGYPP